jgi:hypothetical protein
VEVRGEFEKMWEEGRVKLEKSRLRLLDRTETIPNYELVGG